MLIKSFQKLKVFELLLILFLFGCSKEFPEKRFSIPDWKSPEQSSEYHKVYFAIYGNVFETQEHIETKRYQEDKSISFKVGGKNALKEYLTILKKRYQKDLITISTAPLVNYSKDIVEVTKDLQFFSELFPDVAHFSYKDLAYFARERFTNKEINGNLNLSLINSNIIEHKNNDLFLPVNSHSEKIVNVENQKIAFISINYAHDPDTNKLIALPGLVHQDPILAILKEKEKLKSHGTISIVLLVDVPSNCRSVVDFKKFNTFEFLENTEIHCDENDPFLKLVKRFPPQLIDAIILTNPKENKGNKFLIGTLNEIPVMKLDNTGKYILLTEMSYDVINMTAKKNKFTFWPPIKLCEEFILSTQDCYTNEFDTLPTISKVERPSELALIPAKFLGFEITTSRPLQAN